MAAILLDRHLQSVANYLILRWHLPEHSYHWIYHHGHRQHKHDFLHTCVKKSLPLVNDHLATIIWQILFSSLAVADLLVAILVMPLGAVKEVRTRYISNIDVRSRYLKYWSRRCEVKTHFQYWCQRGEVNISKILKKRYLQYSSKTMWDQDIFPILKSKR